MGLNIYQSVYVILEVLRHNSRYKVNSVHNFNLQNEIRRKERFTHVCKNNIFSKDILRLVLFCVQQFMYNVLLLDLINVS